MRHFLTTEDWSRDELQQMLDDAAAMDALRAQVKADVEGILDKYGVRAGQFSSDTDDFSTDGADYTSVDVLWRAVNPTPNNYFAVGLGWQQMGLDSIGLDIRQLGGNHRSLLQLDQGQQFLEMLLDWDDNGESDLAGYTVHRSTTAGGPYTALNGTLLDGRPLSPFQAQAVQPGQVLVLGRVFLEVREAQLDEQVSR